MFSCVKLCHPVDYRLSGSSVQGNFPGKNTGVGCHVLLQGIFPIQWLNPWLLCLLHWQVGSLSFAPHGEPIASLLLCTALTNMLTVPRICCYSRDSGSAFVVPLPIAFPQSFLCLIPSDHSTINLNVVPQRSPLWPSISAFLTMPKHLTGWITVNCGKFWQRWEYQTTWPASWETYMQVRKQQLELDVEQQTGSK